MPSLPSKVSRSKHVTPIANLHENDVWQRTFKLLGLTPLTPFPNSDSASTPETAGAMDVEAPAAEGSQMSKPKMSILDLPEEMQKEIFKHASSTDLIALALVSKHFRDIAASQLYRNFYIVFPDEDDPSYDSPIDGLAGGLDTLVTSDYDYSRYLKEINMETLSGGAKGERAYRQYILAESCGKFMNTLFLLALRKAHALETLRWDLRIEISRPLFKVLHQIQALKNIHIRMQAGPSRYESPPPLPSLAQPSPVWELSSTSPSIVPPPPPPPPHFSSTSNSYSSAKSASKAKTKSTESITEARSPPTFSGFRSLKSLSVLDMDTLEYVDELNACISNSSGTLRKLKLSFAETLARQSRKPPPTEDPNDESDQEMDEFGQMNPPPPPPPIASSNDDFTGPAKAFRAQEEKKTQEGVLGRIFGIEPSTTKKTGGEPEISSDTEEKPEDEKTTPGKTFARDLTKLSKQLMTAISGTSRNQQQKEALALIEKAAKLYVSSMSEKAQKKADKKTLNEAGSEGSSTAKATPESSAASVAEKADEENTTESKGKEHETTSKTFDMFGEESKKQRKAKDKDNSPDDSNPDDINIDEPEVVTDLKDFEEIPDTPGKPGNTTEELDKEVKILEESRDEGPSSGDASNETNFVVTPDPEKAPESFKLVVSSQVPVARKTSENQMNEYLRDSHGLQIHTLAIYLIPIKASILSKAIDLYKLENITLLNVGPQAPFWNLLSKQNKQSPLPLKKIFTDNVTIPFLTCVSQLDSITQLFMLERNSKIPEYSFASKTSVKMEQIRKIVLKKHISTLEQLMIKNENDPTWDASEQVIKLICKRGKNLEELALSFGVRAVHTFNQYLPGLVKLRALHIITFRNDDTCHWVVREVRRFAVDNVSHNTDMKLEYIGMDNSVERLVRRVKLLKPKSKGKEIDKGKGKEVDNTSVQAIESFITLSDYFVGGGPQPGDESSDDESGSEDGLSPGLKLETLEGVRFYDIYGVRIFRKDVMAGRL